MDKIKKRKKNLKNLVIDFESINYCDASAVEIINVFIEDLKAMKIDIYFINVN
jgi:anti-anti-sigma regulatory factor